MLKSSSAIVYVVPSYVIEQAICFNEVKSPLAEFVGVVLFLYEKNLYVVVEPTTVLNEYKNTSCVFVRIIAQLSVSASTQSTTALISDCVAPANEGMSKHLTLHSLLPPLAQ